MRELPALGDAPGRRPVALNSSSGCSAIHLRKLAPRAGLEPARGPGNEVVTLAFAHVTERMTRQAEIEQHLLAARYPFTQASPERRNGHGIWSGPDRRRATSEDILKEQVYRFSGP